MKHPVEITVNVTQAHIDKGLLPPGKGGIYGTQGWPTCIALQEMLRDDLGYVCSFYGEFPKQLIIGLPGGCFPPALFCACPKDLDRWNKRFYYHYRGGWEENGPHLDGNLLEIIFRPKPKPFSYKLTVPRHVLKDEFISEKDFKG